MILFFFFQAEDGIRDADVTGVQTCALPISAVTYFPLIILPGPTSCPLWGTFSCSDFGCLPWLSGFSGFIVCLRFFISGRVACAKVLRCFCCSRLPCCYWFL